jgi:pimeloyl-ACP methyl ester carboxylesterase
MPVIDVNGVALNYRELGNRDKRTVIFAHPMLFGSEAFDHLASELVNDYHLILLDLHGHGESGYRTPITLEEMAADYYYLLTRLDLTNVSWIGHSIGGMIGMRLALAYPESIDSLILIATTARLDPPWLREQAWPLWEKFRDGHREEIVDAALQFNFAPATLNNQPQLIEHYREKVISYQNAEGVFEAVRAVFNRTDIGDQISAIKAPTLAVAGKEDTAISPAESEFIASRIPNAQLSVIDEASHMLVVEKPREVAQIIREFLKLKKVAGEGV